MLELAFARELAHLLVEFKTLSAVVSARHLNTLRWMAEQLVSSHAIAEPDMFKTLLVAVHVPLISSLVPLLVLALLNALRDLEVFKILRVVALAARTKSTAPSLGSALLPVFRPSMLSKIRLVAVPALAPLN